MSDEPIATLRRRDARIATCWVPRMYTTDPPRLTPRTTWRLEVRLVCATVIRVVTLLSDGGNIAWGLHSSRPQQEVTLAATFQPDGSEAGRTRITFEYATATHDDESLTFDPRGAVAVVAPETTTTGQIVDLAKVGEDSIGLSVLMLDVFDCEDRRMDRWRVRPELHDALPPFLADATSGRRHGPAQSQRQR